MSLWLSPSGLTGTTGEVGSGLVPGLKGYGESNRLPMVAETTHKKRRGSAKDNS